MKKTPFLIYCSSSSPPPVKFKGKSIKIKKGSSLESRGKEASWPSPPLFTEHDLTIAHSVLLHLHS